ncbi:DUF3016 domain-containing protein [Dokdonella sp.]|uniref:DUF3016 domain-containing protein n=1 Tax=Dokdonella sp. TaxID=2291710 RepID=UPI003783291D
MNIAARRRSTPFVAFALLFVSLSAVAADDARVRVDWTDPAQFTELKHYRSFRDMRPAEWLDPLAQHLRKRAERVLPPGDRLEVTFTDVQRAGNYEPWHGPRLDDVRIVRDIYPPRIDLRFRLIDANGGIVREGERMLRDSAFLMRDGAHETDSLRFEKRLLDQWLRKEFAAGPR